MPGETMSAARFILATLGLLVAVYAIRTRTRTNKLQEEPNKLQVEPAPGLRPVRFRPVHVRPGLLRDDDWQRVPLFFHETNLTELLWLGPGTERSYFHLAECAKTTSTECVPSYLLDWQRAMRMALPRGWTGRWRSCSVVGSSNSLMLQANGGRIDGASAVFRMNDAPTDRYAAHTGNRTTLRFWGAPIARHERKNNRTVRWGLHPALARTEGALSQTILACPPKNVWAMASRCWDELHLINATSLAAWIAAGRPLDLDGRAINIARRRLTPAQVRTVHAPRLNPNVSVVLRQYMRALTNRTARRHPSYWNNPYPTTGALGLFAALRSCEHVAIYGFGGAQCSKVAAQRGKYYVPRLGRRAYLAIHAHGHDYDLEQAWIRRLVHDGRVEDAEGCFQG